MIYKHGAIYLLFGYGTMFLDFFFKNLENTPYSFSQTSEIPTKHDQSYVEHITRNNAPDGGDCGCKIDLCE